MRVGQMSARAGDDALPAPLVLDRYRLHRRLGGGGFGTVWMARDEHLQRDVAVKILPRDRIVGGRFEREAHAAARLAHPAIVTLYEAAADDEGAYLVSELVRGVTLDRALAAGRLSDRTILAIGIALCDALAHAHAQGIVHRDVKPSNILVPAHPASAAQVAKLTDFGVARVVGGDTLTVTGELIGTLRYMAPEQAEGREAGEAADLYSLALVVYEALTGVNPVPVTRPGGPRPRRLAIYLPPLRRQRRELPRELGQAIDLALRPRARERGSLAELCAGLQASIEYVSDRTGVVAAPRLALTTARWTRRNEATRSAPPTAPARIPPPSAATAAPDPALPDPAARGHAPLDLEPDAAPAEPRPPIAAGPPRIARALAAAATAGLAAWIATTLLHPSPLPPATLALVAGLAMLLLPRLAWLGLAVATVAGLAAQGSAGAAMVVAAMLALPIPVLVRRPSSWPLAAFAPALAAVGLGGAWPAVAALSPTAWRRAALGALGWCWLCLVGALADRGLYIPPPSGRPAAAVWFGSPYEALHHVLAPIALTTLPAGAAVWALGAATLPLLPRRSGWPGALWVALWSVGVAMATSLAVAVAGAGGQVPSAGALALGAAAAAVVSLRSGAWRAAPPWAMRRALRSMGQP